MGQAIFKMKRPGRTNEKGKSKGKGMGKSTMKKGSYHK